MKFAAIDVGSNAVRLLLSRVIVDSSPPIFKKECLVRMPIRLGEDAFTINEISPEKSEMLFSTMRGFRHLMNSYQALDYLACATSAMREATNGAAIAEKIKAETGIELEIVPGQKEADIIFSNHFEERLDPRKSFLYIDVGGGSTEITVFSRHRSITSRSFNLGTVRLLHGMVDETEWGQMRKWLQAISNEIGTMQGIGSGGNINKVFRISRVKDGRPISLKKIREIHDYLNTFSLDERIKVLNLRPDRADVIIPALEIFRSAMKWAKVKRLFVPQIGLSDGLIRILHSRYKAAEQNPSSSRVL
jgi:exopolyphosphatase/guanosine-5'-triphosphate,3'-diphosphate pyrophosphatase